MARLLEELHRRFPRNLLQLELVIMEFVKKDETYKIIESLEDYYIEGLYIISTNNENRININLSVYKKVDNALSEILYTVYVILNTNDKDQVTMTVAGQVANFEGLSHVVSVVDGCIKHFNPYAN